MEYIPAENRLLVRADVGWGDGVVGPIGDSIHMTVERGGTSHTLVVKVETPSENATRRALGNH
jgi:hypothetical protein